MSSRVLLRPNICTQFARTQFSTGITEFDALLGGGIDSGSSTLILGPAGTGNRFLP